VSDAGGRDRRAVRAASFARAADLYERARPGYPEDAVRWLAGDVPCDVVDLGAGTGKLTATLAALGHRVVAIEPLAEMREQLEARLLGVPCHGGSAESMPLPNASADVVTVAQAFHWFDHGPALAEIARVLRPGGTLAIAWNIRDERVGWVAQLSEIIGAEHMRRPDVEEALAIGARFAPPAHARFHHATPLDREALLDLVRSRSHCIVREPAEREEILARVGRLHDEAAGPEGLELPYVVECYRAVRVG
jgi:SAM-dependent methyltransferase